ncbi:hypothetical protein N9852_04905, partial [Alphaproteobacteria bacterium]|nr:hypothetical protein [Alphaproteobacteria bacterium]
MTPPFSLFFKVFIRANFKEFLSLLLRPYLTSFIVTMSFFSIIILITYFTEGTIVSEQNLMNFVDGFFIGVRMFSTNFIMAELGLWLLIIYIFLLILAKLDNREFNIRIPILKWRYIFLIAVSLFIIGILFKQIRLFTTENLNNLIHTYLIYSVPVSIIFGTMFLPEKKVFKQIFKREFPK